MICEYCGKEFKRLGSHLARSKCGKGVGAGVTMENGTLESGCCRDCGAKTVSKPPFVEDVLVCKGCQEEDPNCSLITKSRAKSEYGLVDKELASLRSKEVANPHYRCASSMVLYLQADVEQFAEEHSGEIERRLMKREQLKKRRAIAKEKAEAERKLAKESRRVNLESALANIGLVRRPDSSLCDKYVEEGEPSLEHVVTTCAQMRFLHDYTDYATQIEREVEEIVAHRGFYYQGIYRQASEYAKDSIIRKIGGWPTQWPWLTN